MLAQSWSASARYMVYLGVMIVLSGCAASTTSVVAGESHSNGVELPDLVAEERVSEDKVVASSEPPISEVELTEVPNPVVDSEPPAAPEPPAVEEVQVEEVAVAVFLLDVPFNFDQHGLRDDALAFLEVNVNRMTDEGVGPILLEGRGDEVGTSDYNLVLGQRRALAVKRYLQNLGVKSSRIMTTSFGKERPLCFEHSVECWKVNRSVRFVVQ